MGMVAAPQDAQHLHALGGLMLYPSLFAKEPWTTLTADGKGHPHPHLTPQLTGPNFQSREKPTSPYTVHFICQEGQYNCTIL